jgi:CYTH domain-containing protein
VTERTPGLTRDSLAGILHRAGIRPDAYHLFGAHANDAVVIDHRPEGWFVFYSEGGAQTSLRFHHSEDAACRDLLARLECTETSRTAGAGRYAQLEREQRWIVSQAPGAMSRPAHIVDLYVTGTRLRLRRVQSGGELVFKLAQKVRATPGSAEVVSLTNMYLCQDEYETVARLGGSELRKTRWHVTEDRRDIAVDVFEGRLLGLVLAETELADGEPRWTGPSFGAADVTDDDRFSGGSLAQATEANVEDLMREIGRPGHSRRLPC